MQIFLFSLASWMIYFCVDFLFFLFSAWMDAKVLNLTFTPDTFTILFTIACYISIGVCMGLCIEGVKVFGGKYLSLIHSQWLHLSVVLSVGCISLIHGVLLYKKHILVIPFSLSANIKVIILLLLTIPGLWAAVKITGMIKKSPIVSLISLCISVEVFWNILREGLYPGRYLKDSVIGGSGITVIMLAFAVGILVYTCFYYCVPRLFSKNSPNLMMRFLLITLPGALLFSSMLYGSACHAAQAVLHAKKPNIILIILDTLRSDHMSCYGYPKKTTPNIDAFASEAVQYTHAYPTASWTLPSIASVLTGLYPCGHGAHRVKEGGIGKGVIPIRGLSDDHTTLAEILKKEGYSTAGIISCTFLTKSYGLHQGFDYYDDYIPSIESFMSYCSVLSFFNIFLPVDDFLSSTGHNIHKTAQQVNDSTVSWLNQSDQKKPFFLMAHYFDVHHPFFPEKIGMRSVPTSIKNRYAHYSNYVDLEKQIINSVLSGKRKLLSDERDFLINNYDREIVLLDQKIGELFSFLKENKLYDESLIVILSDHGESFGEHNLMLHGLSLYEDNLRVPLIIKYPLSDQKKGTVDYPVSLAGLAPTLLSYTSIPTPDFMQGSLFSEPQNQKIFSMLYYSGSALWALPELLQGDQSSLLDQNHKLMQFGNGQKQLHDLIKDPEETNNMISKEGSISEKLLADMTDYIKKFTGRKTTEKINQTIDKEAIQNLRNLGYIK